MTSTSRLKFIDLAVDIQRSVIRALRTVNVDNDYWMDTLLDDFVKRCELIGVKVAWNDLKLDGYHDNAGRLAVAEVDIMDLIEGVNKQSWITPDYLSDFELQLDLPMPPAFPKKLVYLMRTGALAIHSKINGVNSSAAMTAEMGWSFTNDKVLGYTGLNKALMLINVWFNQVAEILVNYLYKSIQLRYDWLISDEEVVEHINWYQYRFSADGKVTGILKGTELEEADD